MTPQTVQMKVHVIDLLIDIKNQKVSVSEPRLEVAGGDCVVWNVRGNDRVPFVISFRDNCNARKNRHGKESPFWCSVLTDDGARVPQQARWGGSFKYSVKVVTDPPLYLDPEVVVEPPTYPS